MFPRIFLAHYNETSPYQRASRMGTAPASARPTDPGSRVGSLREGAQRSQNRTTSLQLTNDSRTDGAQQRGAGEMCFPASKRQPTNKVRPLLDGGCTKAHSAECAPVHRSQNRTTSLQLMNETRADGRGLYESA